jgi:uncharacterized protein
MILVDANLLLYAYNKGAPQFRAARAWFEEAMSGQQVVLLPWTTILAFLRISTSSRVWTDPFEMREAASIVDEWIALPNVNVPQPGPRHWPILASLMDRSQCRGALVRDAHLAALAIEHGATLCTDNRGFARFPDLQLFYPLA